MERIICALLVLFAISSFVSAWGQATYEVSASRLCLGFGCPCERYAVDAAFDPHEVFLDTVLHHCYKPELNYSQYPVGSWARPVLNECPSLDKVNIWLEAANNDSACRRWRDISIGLHYFLDSKEFWNNVLSANQSCVSEQESEIDDYLLFGGDNWRSCSCGICYTNEDFNDWLAEYSERVKPLILARHFGSPHVLVVSNSLDRDAALRLSVFLASENITSTLIEPGDFQKYKNSEFIVIAGGQNAPETSQITLSLLTEDDKSAIQKSIFTGVLTKKTNVWVNEQTVYIIAGWGLNETADGLNAAGGMIRDTALEFGRPKEVKAQCLKNDDCGTTYLGPIVCNNRLSASKVLYTPTCKNGKCTQRAGRPITMGCKMDEVCITYQGCTPKSELVQFESLKTPAYDSWLSPDTATTILGGSVRAVMHARTRLNGTSWCEYYVTSWTPMGTFSTNQTLEFRLNVTVNPTVGKTLMPLKIRCGNSSSSGEAAASYVGEHNFTVNSIAPPLAFTIGVKPENVTLMGCQDEKNVTLRIENLCSHNITCDYRIGLLLGDVSVPSVGLTYNITNSRWGWSITNTTESYLDYYSGADFSNGSYTVDEWGDNDTTWKVVKTVPPEILEYYSHLPKNITYYTRTSFLNRTGTYGWDVNHWTENRFSVSSSDCSVSQIPVIVHCTDSYDQHTTLKRMINLNFKRG
jgi:hypothetical protein